MIRRRDFLREPSSTSDWDYEWDYSKGLLSNNGWNKTTSGTASETLKSNGVELKSNKSSYISLRNPTNYNRSSGVIEVVFLCNNFPSENSQNIRVCFGNGTKGIHVCCPYGNLSIVDAEEPVDMTSLGVTLSINTEYTLKLVLDNGYGQVWLGGTLVRSNIDITTIMYSANTSIWSQNQYGYYALIKSVKMKLGRT